MIGNRKHNVIISILLTVCSYFSLTSQTASIDTYPTPSGSFIRGTVVDAESGEKLPLVDVSLTPGKRGMSSDVDGAFSFDDLEAGRYLLKVSYLGFLTIADTIELGSQGVDLQIDLQPTSIVTDAVVVTAARRQQSISLAPVSVGLVTSKDIERQNLQTFDQAFDAMSGVQVTRSSGANVQALSIRGASEVAGGGIGNRVLLLIDGRPSLSPESGGALWNLVPLQSIDRIEVVKGAYSSLFGSSAMGGVINVLTKSPTSSQTSAHLNYGVYGPAPSFTGYDRIGSFYTVEASHGDSKGAWSYLVDLGKKGNDGHRAKSAFDLYNTFGKIVYRPAKDRKLTLSANYNRIENDAPATWLNFLKPYQVAAHREDDYQMRRDYNVDLNYEIIRKSGYKYFARAFYYNNYSRYTFNDNPGDRSENNINFGKISIDESFVRTGRVGFANQIDLEKGRHFFIGGLDLKYDHVNGQPDTVLYGTHQAFSAGIYVQDEITLSDRWVTTMGLRYDYFNLKSAVVESNFSPKIASVYKVSDRFSARVLFAQAFRNPSIAERFIKFEQGGGLRFEPNPSLRAEKLTFSAELGGKYAFNNQLTLDGALFYNSYRDLISFQQVAQASGALLYRVINLNKAIMQGAELNVSYQIPQRLQVNVNYTYLDATDASDNRLNDNLAYKVRHTLNGSVTGMYKNFTATLSGRMRSAIREVFIYP
ncbi:MAG: TonB-dependent receptor, partial [Saprospiraceae bacterium]|nr:TonB-dependent receptor [Saprospiraceae bacterium]